MPGIFPGETTTFSNLNSEDTAICKKTLKEDGIYRPACDRTGEENGFFFFPDFKSEQLLIPCPLSHHPASQEQRNLASTVIQRVP